MNTNNNKQAASIKKTSTKNSINLDYDYNSEYGDGDIPDIDKPKPSNSTKVVPDNRPRRDGPGGN